MYELELQFVKRKNRNSKSKQTTRAARFVPNMSHSGFRFGQSRCTIHMKTMFSESSQFHRVVFIILRCHVDMVNAVQGRNGRHWFGELVTTHLKRLRASSGVATRQDTNSHTNTDLPFTLLQTAAVASENNQLLSSRSSLGRNLYCCCLI